VCVCGVVLRCVVVGWGLRDFRFGGKRIDDDDADEGKSVGGLMCCVLAVLLC